MMLSDVLKTIDMRELGLELQTARKRRGIRQEDAAKAIGVARTTMTAIEKGARRISGQELVALARLYECQFSDFVRARPVVNPSAGQFRGPHELPEAYREMIEPEIARLIEYARTYVELEQLTQSPLVRFYPEEYPTTGGQEEELGERIALAERQRLGLGDGPLPNLRDLLEQYVGLRIFYMPLPNKFSEIYVYDEQLGGCLAVNRNHPEERRRWSLAHGYLHFLAHRQITDVAMDYAPWERSARERLADAFARHFLMPATSLKRRVIEIQRQKGKFTPSDIITLAYLHGASAEAFTLRLEELSLLPGGTWKRLQRRNFAVEQARHQLGLLPVDTQDDLLPTRYLALALEAFVEGLISEGQFAAMAHISRLEARTLAADSEVSDLGMMAVEG
jgi:Zn-dependent peptidase ImmA (M78 family)/DNA-binding XRE family transcriptional regulator